MLHMLGRLRDIVRRLAVTMGCEEGAAHWQGDVFTSALPQSQDMLPAPQDPARDFRDWA